MCVSTVSNGIRGGVESERLGRDRGAREEICVLISCVCETQKLRGQALDLGGDSLTIRGVEGAIGAFGADGKSAVESGDDVA